MTGPTGPVQVFWRPGCGACQAMRIALGEAGVAADWHNVWDHRGAGEYLRSVAGGCETVPTVAIDGQTFIAPSPRRAVDEIERVAPGLVRRRRRWPPFRVAQWALVTSLVATGALAASAGHTAWSYLLDGAAVLAYAGFRRLRARGPQPLQRGAGSDRGEGGFPPHGILDGDRTLP